MLNLTSTPNPKTINETGLPEPMNRPQHQLHENLKKKTVNKYIKIEMEISLFFSISLIFFKCGRRLIVSAGPRPRLCGPRPRRPPDRPQSRTFIGHDQSNYRPATWRRLFFPFIYFFFFLFVFFLFHFFIFCRYIFLYIYIYITVCACVCVHI